MNDKLDQLMEIMKKIVPNHNTMANCELQKTMNLSGYTNREALPGVGLEFLHINGDNLAGWIFKAS